MNTNTVLSGLTVDTLQGYLHESKTWVDFKLKCGLPKSRRQDAIRAYLDGRGILYDHLTRTGQSGMQQKSIVWSIPEDQFRQFVQDAFSWSELLEMCGCEGFGNIRTIRRRIKELGVDAEHLKSKQTRQPTPSAEEVFGENVKTTKNVLRKLLLEEREQKCEKCGNIEWQGHPIGLKVVRKIRKARDNRRENLSLMCPNCVYADNQDRKQ